MAIWHRVLHWFYSRRLNRLTEIIVKNNQEREINAMCSQACTTREQSCRLVFLGFKETTADMARILRHSQAEGFITEITTALKLSRFLRCDNIVPAWSLHRLVKMLPCVVFSKPYALHLTILSDSVFYCTEDNNEDYEQPFSIHNNLYDNLIDCAEWLVRNGYVDKEFLNG